MSPTEFILPKELMLFAFLILPPESILKSVPICKLLKIKEFPVIVPIKLMSLTLLMLPPESILKVVLAIISLVTFTEFPVISPEAIIVLA